MRRSCKLVWLDGTRNFLLFMKHFVKTVKVNIEHPVLLLLDNHHFHLAIDVLDYCKDNGVVLQQLERIQAIRVRTPQVLMKFRLCQLLPSVKMMATLRNQIQEYQLCRRMASLEIIFRAEVQTNGNSGGRWTLPSLCLCNVP